MFKRNRNDEAAAPAFAPSDFERTRKSYFERGAGLLVERNRWFAASMVLGVCVVALAFTIQAILPLKTVEPYVIKVDESGRVSAEPSAAQAYVPQEAEIKYFLKEWAVKLYTIDAALTPKQLPEAYEFTADKATQEFTEWVEREQPIALLAKTPSLVRTVTVNTVSLLPNTVALIRISTEQRSAAREKAERKSYLITVRYALVKPKTAEQIFRNPIGIFVTHFSVNEEAVR